MFWFADTMQLILQILPKYARAHNWEFSHFNALPYVTCNLERNKTKMLFLVKLIYDSHIFNIVKCYRLGFLYGYYIFPQINVNYIFLSYALIYF